MRVPGDVLQDRYELRSILGTGGYGAVYEAYHRHLNHTAQTFRHLVAIQSLEYQGR